MAGLYVHIPFCRAKCAYCDFYSGPLRGFDEKAYFHALQLEFKARAPHFAAEFDTAYIGGGTPSSVNPELLAPFLAMGRHERTVEVNPEDVTVDYARALRRAGANRVSMGVQSLNDAELRAVGRRHSAAEAIEAFHRLREAGFTNISLDLIYGLPGQTLQSWTETLQRTLRLQPEHLSAYSLSYEPGTLLHTRLKAGKISETDDDTVAAMYDTLCREASRHGFEHYEISNFARPGFESKHNSAYWDFTPYLGLGPGAHSFDGQMRGFNPANLPAYMEHPSTAFTPEPETDTERHNDMVMTALRTAKGISAEVFTSTEMKLASKLLVPAGAGRLRISEADWLLSDGIISDLFR